MDLKARVLPWRDSQKDTSMTCPCYKELPGQDVRAGLRPRAHGLSGAGASGLAGRAPRQGGSGVRIYHPYY